MVHHKMKTVNLCRFCNVELAETVVDLGVSPIANKYVRLEDENKVEYFYPLHVFICTTCWLMQIPSYHTEEQLFTADYAYYSSYSTSWLKHAEDYVTKMIDRFNFDKNSSIIELASNDGYLLQYFQKEGIPVLGVEPCLEVAKAGEARGIPAIKKFFGVDVAKEMCANHQTADLVIANNVFAHVPDINDFLAGARLILNVNGIITMEFQNTTELLKKSQFDTIYHEHFTYYSFIAVQKVFAHHGLTIFDVEELGTHGGSLRIYARRDEDKSHSTSPAVARIIKKELALGMNTLAPYKAFGEKVKKVKRDLLNFLNNAQVEGKFVVAYGAPAKGNTLLNYCGVRTDYIQYTVERNPHKQNHLLPGTHIPIVSEEMITKTKPDYILILPWNLKEEITEQLAYVTKWGCQFVVPIPQLEIFSAPVQSASIPLYH